jgi:hypothetical protein
MEEEKKEESSSIKKVRQDLKSTKTEIEILESARLGNNDYDYNSVKIIKEGGQAVVFEIRSNIDGKTYAAKRL